MVISWQRLAGIEDREGQLKMLLAFCISGWVVHMWYLIMFELTHMLQIFFVYIKYLMFKKIV